VSLSVADLNWRHKSEVFFSVSSRISPDRTGRSAGRSACILAATLAVNEDLRTDVVTRVIRSSSSRCVIVE